MNTRKKRRLYGLSLALIGLGIAAALVLTAFRDTLVFFYTPSDLAADHVGPGRMVRLGGMVETGSVARTPDGTGVTFRVTDTAATLPVRYTGVLPDLFREGQGVVAEGRIGADGTFVAQTVLAKHDERYMPPEVAKGIARAGELQHATGTLERR